MAVYFDEESKALFAIEHGYDDHAEACRSPYNDTILKLVGG